VIDLFLLTRLGFGPIISGLAVDSSESSTVQIRNVNIITTKVANLKSDANRWGWKGSIFSHVAKYAARHLGIHINVIRICSLAASPQYPSTLPDVTYRLIQAEELIEASSDPELGLNPDFVNAAIDRGDFAFGAFDGPVLAAYVWRTLTSAPHTDELWVRVDRPYVYAYKSFTRIRYRGKHLMPSVLLFSDKEMLKHGYTHRAGFVAIHNLPSLAAGKHMATKVIGYAGYLDWFGRRFPFRTRAVKNIGFEFFEHGRDRGQGLLERNE